MVQRQLSWYLLSANVLSEGYLGRWGAGGGRLLLPQTTFVFKFLKITKLPLYMEWKITCAPSSCGSTLDFAVFVLSRFWWQPDGGSRSVIKPGSEEPSCWSNCGNVSFPTDLICDPALDQTPWEDYPGLKQLLKRTDKGSVMLHYYDEIHLPLLVFPFTFHIDEIGHFSLAFWVSFSKNCDKK